MSFRLNGEFIATIAGVDQSYAVPNTPKPAAFGIVIQAIKQGAVTAKDSQPVPSDDADETEALVLAVKHLLECCNKRSYITLQSNSTYIVDTINKLLANWKKNGWRNNQGKSPSYIEHWMEIDRLMNEKNIIVEAVHVKKDQAAKDPALQYAKELAVAERDIYGRKIGAPLSGFGPRD